MSIGVGCGSVAWCERLEKLKGCGLSLSRFERELRAHTMLFSRSSSGSGRLQLTVSGTCVPLNRVLGKEGPTSTCLYTGKCPCGGVIYAIDGILDFQAPN